MGLSDYLGRFWHSSEAIFGVIIVICFTSILRADPAMADLIVWRVVEAALACCIAWGLVDGIFYAWESHYDIKEKEKILSLSRMPGDQLTAKQLIQENLEDTIIGVLGADEKTQLYNKIVKSTQNIEMRKISLNDSVITVLITFCLVVGTASLVLLPFVLIFNVATALLSSNLIGIAVLYSIGYWRERDRRVGKKLKSGFITALLALVIALVTAYLGG